MKRYPRISSPTKSRRNAMALVFVLVFVALLGLLCTGLSESLRVRLVEATARAEQTTLREAARSALDATLARLGATLTVDGALYGPARGWPSETVDLGDDYRTEGVGARVEIVDESGRFPINTRDTAMLAKLFEDTGVSREQAEELADIVADWTDDDGLRRDSGAEAADYPPGVVPPDRPLETMPELDAIPAFRRVYFEDDGTLNAKGRLLADTVGFFDTPTKPNINGAPPAVIRMLARRTGVDGEALLRFRSTPKGTASSGGGVFKNEADLARVGATGTLAGEVAFMPTLLRISITVTKGYVSYRLECLVRPGVPGEAGVPFKIVRIAENGRLTAE